MNMNRLAVLGGCGVMTAGLMAVTVIPAVATPQETGCAGGWQALSVSGLIAQGYSAGLITIDVNNDDTICGKPLSAALQAKKCEEIGGCTVPVIYWLGDNDLPRAQ